MSIWSLKRSRRHFLQWALASTATSNLLSNCRQTSSPAQDETANHADFSWQRYHGRQITLLLDDHPWTTGLKPYLANFEALTGIKTNLKVVGEPFYFQAMEAAMREDPVGADVIFLPMDSTAYRLWQDDLLHPLTPLINNSRLTATNYNVFDFPEGFRLAAVYPPESAERQLFGIPATFEAYVMFYNQELVNYYLDGEVPQTMAQLIDAANQINEAGHGEFFGAVMRGVASDAIIDTVTGIVLDSWGMEPTPLPYNLWFDGDWRQPRFTDPRIVDGLTAYARLMQAGPTDIKQIDWPQATRLFQDGKAAFYIDASLFGPSYEKSGAAIAGNVGYTILPRFQSESLTGHWLWGLGITAKSTQPEAAWLFVQWATSQQIEPLIAVATGGAPRFSSWLTPSPYTEAMDIDYALCVQTAMQTSRPTVVLHPRWNEVALAIASTIQEIYDGADGAIAASQLQQRVMDIMA